MDVEQHNVHRERLGRRERRVAVRRLTEHLEAVGLEQLTRPGAERRMVVDDQDTLTHSRMVTRLGRVRGTAVHTLYGNTSRPPDVCMDMRTQPNLNLVAATCSTCGATHTINTSTRSISIDVCSNCHPAYTGRDLTVARGGRVERFNRRRELAA
jgi:large subunit ribosomal protein L31